MTDQELLIDIESHIASQHISLTGIRKHTKASEEYVDVIFRYPETNKEWSGSIPFHYRRAGIFLDNPKDIAELIKEAYKQAEPNKAVQWVRDEKKHWEENHSSKQVTKGFFDALLNLRWNCIECDFPSNPNWARRIQDIKEMGYLLATDRKVCARCNKNNTHMLLVPFEKSAATGYETWTPELKKKIINVLKKINVYENKPAASVASIIPDHKFPEIRWDADTKEENTIQMTDKEIKEKFQLLDNQRNLQKREVCRKCFQSGIRGTAFGITYFYKGNGKWPEDTPKIGKVAEKGCVGCPWYDFDEWRKSLNQVLNKKDHED
ncbi:restriction endonuclease [Patescibacteria group bacterium]